MDNLFLENKYSHYFEQLFNQIDCETFTKSYITGIFLQYLRSAQNDLSQENITLTFAKAREENNFLLYQKIGDYLFFMRSMYPNFLINASEDYYRTVARMSYYSCYNLINKKILVYENMADEFISLEQQARKIIINARWAL